MQENKENLYSYSNANSLLKKEKEKRLQLPGSYEGERCNDSSIMEETSLWHQQSDVTFETIERMCNKTLSDPENSIHDYLENWETRKKKTSKSDEEIEALNRLYQEFGIDNENSSKEVNQTQLSEVEPPSCLWDNTVNNETCHLSSPVKIVGLLRPSTILEESGTESIASSNSFKSAQPPPTETASSDQYETANETHSEEFKERIGHRDPNEINASISTDSGRSTTSRPDASAYFEMFPLRKLSYPEKFKGPRIYNKAVFLPESAHQKDYESSLKRLDETSKISSISNDSLNKPKRKSRSSKFMEDSLEAGGNLGEECNSMRDIKKETRFEGSRDTDACRDESSVILISDDEADATSNDDLNRGFYRDLETPTDDSVILSEQSDINVSREFNDTLEEIEYIMKKGRKYLADQQTTPLKTKLVPIVRKTPVCTTSPATPCTVIKKPKSAAINQQSSPLLTKTLFKSNNVPKFDHRFDHIISPIRTYIHNTPKSPITTTMKTTQSIFDTKYGRESRPPSRNNLESLKETPPKALCSLPRKAYISAEYKHVVDQRSPISIPGGEKIHQYLGSGMVPAVLRHEGKFKTDMSPRKERNLDKSSGSLANFSLASGDMSVLLLKDAKDLASKY
ncbi:unnamed protein product [Hermetia illucens]|uniref:Uncharacterized protein n=1 Tax=Hermetia illucens TaxID=343691 RepID=A0A7R8UR55_HERIL|nr:uncharacterized protein LOC119651353 [Hermetia illucens]XP_037910841.1 uncharacterized protein LOC119651353 [Hermetia illucens]XP_037910842.1 uncharacterized protein LOC119651353 [Hermetia illucens]CAD7085421.1 unnamed protein product [Hermetia illucens]